MRAEWQDGAGRSGQAHAVPLTVDSGYFWFFEPGNVEIAVKALDGCGVNDRRWFFAGGLTNLGVSVYVTDLTSGVTRIYVNPPGQPYAPIADTAAFESCKGEIGAVNPEEPGEDSLELRSESVSPASVLTPCRPDGFALCLRDGRYRVAASWYTASGHSGAAHAVALTAESGYFWFFGPDNVELVAKVLDACAIGRGEWFFAAGMTTVGVHVTVTDTVTGVVREYENPVGSLFAPILDTGAFSACPTATPLPSVTETPTSARTPTVTPSPRPAALVRVRKRWVLYSFSPDVLHVRVGDTVHWFLFEGHFHVTKALDGSWDSGPPGEYGFSHTFMSPGQFFYSCPLENHRGVIMVSP